MPSYASLQRLISAIGGTGLFKFWWINFLLLFHLAFHPRGVHGTISEMFFYQMSCTDDMSLVRSMTTDCSKYIVCTGGYSLGFSCPPGYIFSDFSMRCQLPSLYDKQRCSSIQLANMPLTCLEYPHARIASYLSCAQYFDCSGQYSSSTRGPPSYVTECPYPKLFSPTTGKCELFHKVRCVGRTEPKAPCDYLQYQQLCEGPDCPPCEDRHPSCVGKFDGTYPVGNITSLYIVCFAERTINIGRCAEGFQFSTSRRTCVSSFLPSSPSEPKPLSAILSEIQKVNPTKA